MTIRQHLPKLITALVLSQAAGLIGALATRGSIDSWYTTLARPEWAPPNWVFGPVWTLLYLMMGTAFFLVWSRRVGGRLRVLWLRVFLVHLVLNTLWSYLFFGVQRPDLAFAEILVLLASILILIGTALRFDKRAAALLVPYAAWVSFASYLNYAIWQLN
jgi:tryptophan-rich sensory protein